MTTGAAVPPRRAVEQAAHSPGHQRPASESVPSPSAGVARRGSLRLG